MSISIVPYIGLIGFAIQFLYPGYETARLVLQEKPMPAVVSQWMVYWLICVSFMMVESNVLFFLIDYFPLYMELRAIAFLWLAHPSYLGASWLWYSKVKAIHKGFDDKFYAKILAVWGPLGQAAASGDAAKEEPKSK